MSKNMDLESQQIKEPLPLQVSNKTPRRRWRCLKLILHARHRILILVASKANEVSIALRPQEDYRDLEITTIKTPEVTLDIYSHDDDESQLDVVVSVENDTHHDGGDLHLQFININRIIKEKDVTSLREFGGAQGLAEALGSDLEKGIPEDDQHLCCRKMARQASNLQAPSKGFKFRRLLRSSNNYIMLLLLLCAFLSIGFGIEEEGLKTGWFEGVIILNAMVILLLFPLIRDSLNNHLRLSEKQKLTEERELEVEVVRGGTEEKIFISEILIGDVVCLKRGCHIPADGLFVSGDLLELDDGLKTSINASNPFLFYGAVVINGKGRMMVTSVGENTLWAEMISGVCHFNTTRFEAQLDKINTCKQIVGLIISIFIILVLFLRFELAKEQVKSGIPDIKGKPINVNDFKDVIKRIVTKPNGKISTLTTWLTMILVGVVEGLPFCITLAIAYWRRTGLPFAQELSACVAMGSVTTICMDKLGGLTLEPLEVDKFLVGEDEITKELFISSDVGEAIREGISTTLLLPQALRSATDEPLLSWAVFRFHTKLEPLRRSCATILQVREFIDKEGRRLLMKKNNGDTDTLCLHCTGPATKILPKCSHYFNKEGMLNDLDEGKRSAFDAIVDKMQSTDNLKVIALAYKQNYVTTVEENDLTLLGLVSLKMSIRADIKESIQACKSAGVRIILVSGEDVKTLVAIAQKFGILEANSIGQEVITGQDFRNLTDEERMEKVSGILIMGNSLPSDKHLLVNFLRKNRDSVAVIGIGTNDVPVLKAANVGLAMGSWSNNVARASANIIMWDTNISILLPMLRYGRCIKNNIQNYIQLELTMLVSGLLISSITIACTGNMPLTTIQSSWVNMVVPILGGLALLTESPLEKLMKQLPKRNESVITKALWKNIIPQAIYQAIILVTFQFKGEAILGVNQKLKKTIIFNSFVLCQLFNQFNLRELELKNKFRAIQKNHWLWVAFGVTVILQEIFIEIAHLLANNSRLNWAEWGICFLIGMAPMTIDWAEKFVLGFMSSPD